jgi:2-oxoglutarate ferredoxin oxidoreductase subunit gamma
MLKKIILAGFGGQGVVFAGQLLATAGMQDGYNVTIFPSYGPEMRGGTANCTTVISSDEVYSPVVALPNILVSLNQPSQDKFEPHVEPGGLVLYNQSLISHIQARKDLNYFPVPASEMATKIGTIRVANVIAAGALVAHTRLVKFETLRAALIEMVGAKAEQLLDLNLKALDAGKLLAEEFTSSHRKSQKPS